MHELIVVASDTVSWYAFDSSLRGYKGEWETWAPPAPTPPPAAADTAKASGQHMPIERMVNFRLFQLHDDAPGTIHQTNMYQRPGPAAAGYKQFLTADTSAGRADGYATREWVYDCTKDLFNVSTCTR